MHHEDIVDKTLKDATTDVAVGVGSAVVVDVEQAVIEVLAIVTAHIQTRVGRVEVPVIAGTKNRKHRKCTDDPV